ncbi:nuclear transport factor 2 family protein [Phenylobacterium sp.]|jgi:ketosteroid isomerase-like protein|uniref:YybH family protein n=1 Tax=Phenylobacterium sp. TaxID=1871053 RepID=UPI002F3EC955
MIRNICLVAAVCAGPLLLAACDKAAAPAADPAKEAAAIQAQIDLFNSSMKAGDVEKAISVEATDFHSFGGGPDVTSATEDLKGAKESMHDPNYGLVVKADHTEVAKAGDMAWQYGTWDATASDKAGKPVKANGHWVAAWRKDDQGRWKLAAVSNANAWPGGAAAAAAK